MATDLEIRDAGFKYIPQQQYLLNPFEIPGAPEEPIVNQGIVNTNAFTNMNTGGGDGDGITTLNPYYTSKGVPFNLNSLTKTEFGYNNALGKTIQGLKNFGSSVVDTFSGLPGVEQGKGLIRNILDNTIIGRMAAMRNPLNPNASNYNAALQGQIDFLNDLSVDGTMMIGRDPNTGLAKYGPDSVLSGQNVVSGFGTNDYGKQLEKNLERLENVKNKNDKTYEMIEKTKAEIAALEAKEEEDYQNRIDNFVKNYNRPAVKEMFDQAYDGTNIHGGDTTTDGTTTTGGGGEGAFDPSGPTQASIRGERPDKSGSGHIGGFTDPGKGSYGPHKADGGRVGLRYGGILGIL